MWQNVGNGRGKLCGIIKLYKKRDIIEKNKQNMPKELDILQRNVILEIVEREDSSLESYFK